MENAGYTHCLRCGRRLKNEEAQKLGYGKVCIKKMKTSNNRLFECNVIYLNKENCDGR